MRYRPGSPAIHIVAGPGDDQLGVIRRNGEQRTYEPLAVAATIPLGGRGVAQVLPL